MNKPRCSSTVTEKGLTLKVILVVQEQESESFETSRTTVIPVTPESSLVLVDPMMTSTRVETRLNTAQIWRSAHQSHGVHPGAVNAKDHSKSEDNTKG